MESQQRVIRQMKNTNQIYGYLVGFKQLLQKDVKRDKGPNEQLIRYSDEFIKKLEMTNAYVEKYLTPD